MQPEVCKYGEACYRKNPEHFVEFAHPWIDVGLKKARIEPNLFPTLSSVNPDLVMSPGPWQGCKEPRNPLTACEQNMMRAMGAVRTKPDWQKKALDETIRLRWQLELKAQHYHRSQVDYMLAELAYMAEHSPFLSPVDGVYQMELADSTNPDLQSELLKGLAPLERQQLRDYHPGTNEQVGSSVVNSFVISILSDTKGR